MGQSCSAGGMNTAGIRTAVAQRRNHPLKLMEIGLAAVKLQQPCYAAHGFLSGREPKVRHYARTGDCTPFSGSIWKKYYASNPISGILSCADPHNAIMEDGRSDVIKLSSTRIGGRQPSRVPRHTKRSNIWSLKIREPVQREAFIDAGPHLPASLPTSGLRDSLC